MSYILIDTEQNKDRFGNVGLSEDQIGEIAQAELAINALIEQYILELRLRACDMELETWEAYMEARLAVKTLQGFQKFMHNLPLEKQELERRKIVEEAEKKLEKE